MYNLLVHTSRTRELAVVLRESGFSYTHISQKTGLSKSTLSGWLSDVPYKPNAETISALGKARAASTHKKDQLRKSEMKSIRERAEGDIGDVTNRDLFMFGLGLYMGEGAKTNGVVSIANSDPKVMKCMVAWLLSLGVQSSQISARIFLYPDSNEANSLQFWSNTTNIPESQFQATYVDRRTDKKKKNQGKLPHGTLHLYVRARGQKEYGVLFFRRIKALMESVQERI